MAEFVPLWRSPVQLAAGALAVAGTGFVGFLPLFGGPGYEAALAAGLLLPSAAAVATALEVTPGRAAPLSALGRGLASGAALAGLGYLVALLHGLRAGFCDPLEGSALYWLGGGAGALMGGAWGAAVGLLLSGWALRRARAAAVLGALGGPALGILGALYRFYATPMVFAFDHCFGYFAGTVYDTELGGLSTLATFRGGTLLGLLTAAAGAALLRREGRALALVAAPPRGLCVLVALGATGTIAHALGGARLGHWSTAGSIARELGGRLAGERCEVLHDAAIAADRARLVLRECEAHVRELEAFWGTRAPARIRVFLFASAEQKGRLMGATRTQIAKPWRAEIYLEQAPYPHPVLRHELAHVVAGSFGVGPFRVAGPLGGWLPDPGRIEGVAEASAPDDDGELTLAQWARAMRDLGQLPRLGEVFRLSFLGHGAAKAYTTAGAFTAWLAETHGAEAVRRWYGGARLEEVTGGADLGALEQRWYRSLDAVVVPERALPAARARFDRPAIFGRSCPRVVDRLDRVAATALGEGREAAARAGYEALLRLEPGNLRAQLALGTCALRRGDEAEARGRLERLAQDPERGAYDRGLAAERAGDLALLAGDVVAARAAYAAAAETVIDAARLRTLEVKAAFADDPAARAAIVELLVGDRDRGPNLLLAAARLGEWAGARPEDGTPLYLLGKNLYGDGRYREAAAYLDRALERALALPSVREEAWRMRLLAACAVEDLPAARRALAGFEALATPSPARRAGARAVAARCGVAGS